MLKEQDNDELSEEFHSESLNEEVKEEMDESDHYYDEELTPEQSSQLLKRAQQQNIFGVTKPKSPSAISRETPTPKQPPISTTGKNSKNKNNSNETKAKDKKLNQSSEYYDDMSFDDLSEKQDEDNHLKNKKKPAASDAQQSPSSKWEDLVRNAASTATATATAPAKIAAIAPIKDEKHERQRMEVQTNTGGKPPIQKTKTSFLDSMQSYIQKKEDELIQSTNQSFTRDVSQIKQQQSEQAGKGKKSKGGKSTSPNKRFQHIDDIDQVPNEDEIEDIIARNQLAFLGQISGKHQDLLSDDSVPRKAGYVGDYAGFMGVEYERDHMFYDGEDEELQMIQESEHEDSSISDSQLSKQIQSRDMYKNVIKGEDNHKNTIKAFGVSYDDNQYFDSNSDEDGQYYYENEGESYAQSVQKCGSPDSKGKKGGTRSRNLTPSEKQMRRHRDRVDREFAQVLRSQVIITQASRKKHVLCEMNEPRQNNTNRIERVQLENEKDRIIVGREFEEYDLKEMRELQERMKYGQRKTTEANRQKDIEAIKEENQQLKKKIHDQETLIQLLRVDVRKATDDARSKDLLDTSVSSVGSIGSTSTAFTRKLNDSLAEIGKLKEENLKLRSSLTKVKENSAAQMSRQQKLNLEIRKQLGTNIRSLQQENAAKKVQVAATPKQSSNGQTATVTATAGNNKQQIEESKNKVVEEQQLQQVPGRDTEDKLRMASMKLAEVRLDLHKIIQKYLQQKEQLKEKSNEIATLKEKLSNQMFSKQQEKIAQLETKIAAHDQEKIELEEEMALDNQLSLVFPDSMVAINLFFNLCVAVEEVKRGKYKRMGRFIAEVGKPMVASIKKQFTKAKDLFRFFFSKNVEDHPSSKQIVRATIKAWNQSPEIVSRGMRSQQKELKELRLRFIEVDDNNLVLKERNEVLERDVELLRQRNMQLELKLKVDKSRLITNTITQLKHHSVEDEEEDYLLELKQIIQLINDGPPILLSRAEKEEQLRLEAEKAAKERKIREREERKLIVQQKKLERQTKKDEEKAKKEEQEKLEILEKAKTRMTFYRSPTANPALVAAVAAAGITQGDIINGGESPFISSNKLLKRPASASTPAVKMSIEQKQLKMLQDACKEQDNKKTEKKFRVTTTYGLNGKPIVAKDSKSAVTDSKPNLQK